MHNRTADVPNPWTKAESYQTGSLPFDFDNDTVTLTRKEKVTIGTLCLLGLLAIGALALLVLS